jgi:hypothetical protein
MKGVLLEMKGGIPLSRNTTLKFSYDVFEKIGEIV